MPRCNSAGHSCSLAILIVRMSARRHYPFSTALRNACRMLTQDIRFVMVTVDPQRDTPERLAEYVTYFNGDFLGVTGSDEALEQLTRQLGILYNRVESESGSENYLVDHTAAVFLFDPDGRYHAVFTPPLSAENIAGDFRKMLQATQ